MRGPTLFPVTSTATTSSGQISIIGQNGATTAAGAFVGIHVTAGDVYIRGLTISNGSNTGLVVEAGATIRMDRCYVLQNVGGLLVQSGANFDIANSIFDSNGSEKVGTTTTFGGIYLGGAAPATGPNRFWFNTVVNNLDRGVICHDLAQALTGMLLSANITGDYLSCAMDATSEWGTGSPIPNNGANSYSFSPNLDSTDHLTATSHCKGLIAPTVAHPSDDIDGDPRPKVAGGRLDCGADEF